VIDTQVVITWFVYCGTLYTAPVTMVISKGANQMCYLVKGEDHGIAVHPYELNHSLSQNLLVNDGDHFTMWLQTSFIFDFSADPKYL
jgi:hypothetical protein